VTLFLVFTNLGYLPVPGTAGFITIIHLPVILGSVLCGPLVGLGLGAIFGVSNYAFIEPHDPVVQIVPRLLCGLVPALVFSLARRYADPEARITVGAVAAAFSGSYVNTLGVCLLAFAQGYLQPTELVTLLIFHGGSEALMAVVITLPAAVTRYRGD
jgi:uncharacterized membrane protein